MSQLIRKLIAGLAAVVMALSMVSVAFADEAATDPTGTITIGSAVVGENYTVYQVLELESYDATTGAYAYKATDAWAEFVADYNGTYFNVTAEGYVSWVGSDADSRVQALAGLALAWAQENGVEGIDSIIAEDGEDVVFEDLPLGWYLVSSSLGSLCGLDTTDLEVTIAEKNQAPTIEKSILEDAVAVDENNATIGDVITYEVNVTVGVGVTSYILHDVMGEGLTFDSTSVEVEGATGTLLTPTDGCTFELNLTQFTDDYVIVTYSATLNEDAVVAGEGNSNNATLQYGEDHFTTPSVVKTYTFAFELVKTSANKTVLDGAEFALYAEDGVTEIPVVEVEDGIYRVALESETGVSIVAGVATIQGLEDGTYNLVELQQPQGYNKIEGNITITVPSTEVVLSSDQTTYTSGGIQVVNQSGSRLPSTGGIGTTIFYVIGALLVLGAIIYMVSKKRVQE